MSVEKIMPYASGGDKTAQVEQMFDSIAPAYDFMNGVMSLGLHRRWLRKAVDTVAASGPTDILDVATGTGDVAIALAQRMPQARITGVDLSAGMTSIGNEKVAKAGLADRVTLTTGDCMALTMPDCTFDAVTVAYGVRNFAHLDRGYAEMLRVLRPGGMLCVLELSTPVNPVMRFFYEIYTRTLVPLAGRLVSHDSRAYSYLPESIAAVAQADDMLALMRAAGFTDTSYRRLWPGVCTIYTGRRQS